ncbi:MAG: hypothetical protein M3352_06435 [Bacteroidota bacterium]|nr:hypothetical protein [Bacteroidota bacterium]
MKIKFSLLLVVILLSVYSGYSQDSIRTKNDKPGTAQSLRKADNTPESRVQVIKNNTAPNPANINKPSESNTINNATQKTITTDANTTSKPNPTNTITITNTPPATMNTTTHSSATQNGISNAGKPLRKK